MSKGAKSLYTALSSIAYTLIYGLFSLVVIRLIITTYGSDFNGINSAASQFIGILLLFEGGFSMAINVSLFKPIVERDTDRINRILSAAKSIFLKIGRLVLIFGIPASLGYSFLVKSNLPWEITAITFIMVVIPTAINLAYATKYTILLQSDQREYVVNNIKILSVIFSQLLILVIVSLKFHMLYVRLATMAGAILSSIFIIYACKKRYTYLDFKQVPDYSSTKGTKDVMAQKITGMFYGTVPILFISATVGTLYASVYAVYSGVFMLLKGIVSAFTSSPRMGLGQLIAEREISYVKEVFVLYEFLVFLSFFCLLSVLVVLIMPFITLYTEGVSDINYLNWNVTGLFIGITFFEVIHLPSGHIINMAGKFKISRNFQVIAFFVLLTSMITGNILFGFYGILASVLITATLLAVLEISYIHFIYFKGSIKIFYKCLIPNLFLSAMLVVLEINLIPEANGYLMFVILALILIIINAGILLAFNFVINRSLILSLSNRFHALSADLVLTLFKKKGPKSI